MQEGFRRSRTDIPSARPQKASRVCRRFLYTGNPPALDGSEQSESEECAGKEGKRSGGAG